MSGYIIKYCESGFNLIQSIIENGLIAGVSSWKSSRFICDVGIAGCTACFVVSTKTKGYNSMKQWYEELFEKYGMKYDNECFTQGSIGECDFIEKEIGYDKSLRILDIGCGTGRHASELTKRGYSVVGVDLSASQLERARQKASMDNLQINFQKHDARNLPFLREFDLAIMLCEGGFSLMENDEMD
jgi:SAM-dependent methyltransferase